MGQGLGILADRLLLTGLPLRLDLAAQIAKQLAGNPQGQELFGQGLDFVFHLPQPGGYLNAPFLVGAGLFPRPRLGLKGGLEALLRLFVLFLEIVQRLLHLGPLLALALQLALLLLQLALLELQVLVGDLHKALPFLVFDV